MTAFPFAVSRPRLLLLSDYAVIARSGKGRPSQTGAPPAGRSTAGTDLHRPQRRGNPPVQRDRWSWRAVSGPAIPDVGDCVAAHQPTLPAAPVPDGYPGARTRLA